MDKADLLSKLGEAGVVAVLRAPSAELAVRMVQALVAGGVRGIEVTYSTPGAVDVVRTLDGLYGEEILLGMGTLTDVGQARQAQEAGARFIVSPHCDPRLGESMVATGLLVMIGAFTPSEIVSSWRLGADVVKLFPGSLGGPSYLRTLRGPFPDIPIMPTGGVTAENVGEWFAAGALAVGAGSELCPPALAREGRFEAISEGAQRFVQAVAAARRTL